VGLLMTKAQEMLDLADRIEERAEGHSPNFDISLYARPGELMTIVAALRLAAQADAPGGQPQEPKEPKLMYDAQNGDHYVVDESGNAYEPADTRPDGNSK
jgi:hypothetical protein